MQLGGRPRNRKLGLDAKLTFLNCDGPSLYTMYSAYLLLCRGFTPMRHRWERRCVRVLFHIFGSSNEHAFLLHSYLSAGFLARLVKAECGRSKRLAVPSRNHTCTTSRRSFRAHGSDLLSARNLCRDPMYETPQKQSLVGCDWLATKSCNPKPRFRWLCLAERMTLICLQHRIVSRHNMCETVQCKMK